MRRAADAPRATVAVHRRYWLRWWATPQPAWLAARAAELSARLCDAHPAQRHVVVHRFAPEVASRWLWIKRWRVGTLDTMRTLDAAAGAIVHAAAADAALHDGSYAASDDAATALLAMFGFDENLARLRRALADDDAREDTLAVLVDALLVDLATELTAVLAPGWRRGVELDRALPRLVALGDAGLAAGYDTAGGRALIRLAGHLRFLARSQVRWWEAVPPLRWTRRAPGARGRVAHHVDRLLAGAFGAHALKQARADTGRSAAAQAAAFAQARRDEPYGTPPRRAWTRARALAQLAARGVTSDIEVLATAAERVLDEARYAELSETRTNAAARRDARVEAGRAHHRELSIPGGARA